MDTKKYFFEAKITGRIQEIIAPDTAAAMAMFCEQEEELAQAVEQSGKTFQDCLDFIANSIGSRRGVPDLAVFGKAVEFYFPGAKIRYNMYVNLVGDADNSTYILSEDKPKSLSIALDELLNF